MAQEKIGDWWEYAKELAKAERDLQIEHWVRISIEYKDEAGNPVRLHSYDLPRELYERYRWVIRWRKAKLQCLYPRKYISTYYSFYDKRTKLRTDFNSCLMKLAATKAQITIAQRKEAEYIEYQRRNNLFFEESTDERLIKFRIKLQNKQENYTILSEKIRSAVEAQRTVNLTK